MIYNDETGIIETELSDGKRTTVALADIERVIPMSPSMESKYIWLLKNEPAILAELFISGKLEAYLVWYEKSSNEQEADMRKWLEQRYEPEKARMLAREYMMYES